MNDQQFPNKEMLVTFRSHPSANLSPLAQLLQQYPLDVISHGKNDGICLCTSCSFRILITSPAVLDMDL